MAKRKQKRRPMRPLPSLNLQRHFKDGEMPDYKKWEVLSHFISERGKIMPRTRTGLNAPTQRRLTREVKRARYLALLPYAVRPL